MCKNVTKRVNFFFASNLILERWAGPTKGKKVYPPHTPPKPHPAYTSVVLELIYKTLKYNEVYLRIIQK